MEDKLLPRFQTTVVAVPSARLIQQQQQQQPGTTMSLPIILTTFPVLNNNNDLNPDDSRSNTMYTLNTNTFNDDDDDDEESHTLESDRYTLDTFPTLNTADMDATNPTFDTLYTIGDETTTLRGGRAEAGGAAHTAAAAAAAAPKKTHFPRHESAAAGAAAASSALVILSEHDVLREKRLCLASSSLFFVGTLLSFLYCWIKNTHGLPFYPNELVLDLLLCLAHTALISHVVFFEFASLDGGFQECNDKNKHSLQTSTTRYNRRSLDHMRYAQTVSGKRPFSREIRVVNLAQSMLFLLATLVQAVALISVNSYYHQEQQLQLYQQQQALANEAANSTMGYHAYFYYNGFNGEKDAVDSLNADNNAAANSAFLWLGSEERHRLMNQYNWLTFISSLLYFFSAATILVVHAVRRLFDQLRASSSRHGGRSPSRQLLSKAVGGRAAAQPPKKLKGISVTPTLLADIAEHRYMTILTIDHTANALYLFLTTCMLIVSITALSLEDPDVRFFGDVNWLELLAFGWVWIAALYLVADVLRWSYTPPRSVSAVEAEAVDNDEPSPPPFKPPPPSPISRKGGPNKDGDNATTTPPLYNAKSLPFLATSPQYIPAIEVELDVRSLPTWLGRQKSKTPKRPANPPRRRVSDGSSNQNRYIPAIEVELDVRKWPKKKSNKDSSNSNGQRSQEGSSIAPNISANNDNDVVSYSNKNNLNNKLVSSIVDSNTEDAVNSSGTANTDDDSSKVYRSSIDPDGGVLKAETSNNNDEASSANIKEIKEDPPSSMLIASAESLIEKKPSHILATATSLYTTFSNNNNHTMSSRDEYIADHRHDAATGRDASDPIPVQYMAMCDEYGNDSQAAPVVVTQDDDAADNEEDDMITRESLSMDAVCSVPPVVSHHASSLATTTTTLAFNNNNNNDDDFVTTTEYVAMRDSNSPIRARMQPTSAATFSHGDATINNIIRKSRDASSALQDPPESIMSSSQSFVQPSDTAGRNGDSSNGRNNNDDDGDDDNDKSHYEYKRMDYVSSMRRNYIAGHHDQEEQSSEQEDDPDKQSRTTNTCLVGSLRKTPSPSSSLDYGMDNMIQVDVVRKHLHSQHLRWSRFSSAMGGISSSTNAMAGNSTRSSSTRSSERRLAAPPNQQRTPSSSWSQSQALQDFNNNDVSANSLQSQRQEKQQKEQQLPVVDQHETIDLTTAIEERDDGSVAPHDPSNSSNNSINHPTKDHIHQQARTQTSTSPARATRRASPPSYARQHTPFASWTRIEDRKFQQALNKQSSARGANSTSPSGGRFDDLDHFINKY
jgi:hypothetical protein